MFRLIDNAISPRKHSFETAVKRLPSAHREAQHAAVTHLHGRAIEALDSAGLSQHRRAIDVFTDRPEPYVGIVGGPSGDEISDIEFGRPQRTLDKEGRELDSGAPNPVLRTALHRARPEAETVYNSVLVDRLGLG